MALAEHFLEPVAIFDTCVPGNGIVETIVSNYAYAVDVCRFVFAGPYKTFAIARFRIGNEMQWQFPGHVPADMFQPMPEKLDDVVELLHNARARSVWQVGMPMIIDVVNLSLAPMRFAMLVYGRKRDGEIRRMHPNPPRRHVPPNLEDETIGPVGPNWNPNRRRIDDDE